METDLIVAKEHPPKKEIKLEIIILLRQKASFSRKVLNFLPTFLLIFAELYCTHPQTVILWTNDVVHPVFITT